MLLDEIQVIWCLERPVERKEKYNAQLQNISIYMFRSDGLGCPDGGLAGVICDWR
jgi:hypothetical protein